MYSIEALLKQHLWYWLEKERDMVIDAEVTTPAGRIDLAGKTKEGKFIGIEIKGNFNLKVSGSRFARQIRRYINSGYFDEVYFASHNVDDVVIHLDSQNSEPIQAVLSQAARKLNASINKGLIDIDKAIQRIDKELPDDLLEYKIIEERSQSVRDYIIHRLKNYDESKLEPVSLDEGIQDIRCSRLPKKIGIIKIPFSLEGGYLRSPRMALDPNEARSPEVIRKPTLLKKEKTPSFSREEEPWVRHHIWREFGGIPEGTIPNIMESEAVDRPIDVLSFNGSWDPVKIYNNQKKEDIIGIEAKGKSSFLPDRIKNQLNDFIEPGVLSKVFLAVPATYEDEAVKTLDSDKNFTEKVGILTVDKKGNVEKIRSAKRLEIKYDGYIKDQDEYKIGYGKVRIPNGSEVKNPFDLLKHREPLKDKNEIPVRWDFNPLEFEENIIHSIENIKVRSKNKPKNGLKPTRDQCENVRAYLTKGYSADPYANGKNKKRDPKHGFVRLTVRDFKTKVDKKTEDSINSISNREFGLYFHFGRGSWEGGYICFVSEQVDALVKILTSLENIKKAKVPGLGRFIDLEEFRWEYGQNYEFRLDKKNAKNERSLVLNCNLAKDGKGIILNLGQKLTQGAYIKLSKTQRIDLLKTIRLMRYGRPSEIPKGKDGYPRIGPNGKDTWERGTVIEKKNKT